MNRFFLDKYLNDVYDVEGYTTAEVLCKFHEKITKLIDEFNKIDNKFIDLDTNVNEKLTYLLNEGLTTEVSNKIIEMYNNGKLESLINDKLFNAINSQIIQKANINDITNLQTQINNLVVNSGAENSAEIVQARDTETVINSRLNKIENGQRINKLSINRLLKNGANCIDYDNTVFNKRLVGFDMSTGEMKTANDNNACYTKINARPYYGTIEIPIFTGEGQTFLIADQEGKIKKNYTKANIDNGLPWLTKADSNYIIDCNTLYYTIKSLFGIELGYIYVAMNINNCFVYRNKGYFLSENTNLINEFSFNSYPFLKDTKFIKNGKNYKSVTKAIKDIYIESPNPYDKYFIRAVNVHDNQTLLDIHIGTVETNSNVCNIPNIPIENEVKKIKITEQNNSGCTGYIIINPSEVDKNISVFGFYVLDYETSAISPNAIHMKNTLNNISIPPLKVYCTTNNETNIFLNNIFYENANNYIFNKVTGTGTVQKDRIIINTPNAHNSTLVINVYENLTKIGTMSIPIKVTSKANNNGVTKKVLVIGDSFVASGGITGRLREKFENDLMNIKLIGTRGTGTNRHEGYAGWSSYDILNVSEYNNSTNAFIKNGVFDYNNYLSANNLETPDIVILQFGINDLWRPMNGTSTVDNLITLITKIRSVKDDTIIAIGCVCPPYLGEAMCENTKFKHYQRLDLNKNIIDYFKDMENIGIYLIPINYSLDTINSFTLTDTNYSAYTSVKVKKCEDVTHPTNGGYPEIGDIYYNFIKSL